MWPVSDLAAHWSLTALLIQRLLLTLAVAPMLLLSLPTRVLASMTRPAPVDATLAWITRPVVAIAAFTVIVVGTLFTPAVAAQASSPLARGAIDGLLLGGRDDPVGPGARPRPGSAPPRRRRSRGLPLRPVDLAELPGGDLRLLPAPAVPGLRRRPPRHRHLGAQRPAARRRGGQGGHAAGAVDRGVGGPDARRACPRRRRRRGHPGAHVGRGRTPSRARAERRDARHRRPRHPRERHRSAWTPRPPGSPGSPGSASGPPPPPPVPPGPGSPGPGTGS